MADHDHTASEVSGAAHGNDLLALQRRVEELEAKLEAERAAAEAVADGNTTIKMIVQALRNRALNTRNHEMSMEFEILADEIQALGMGS